MFLKKWPQAIKYFEKHFEKNPNDIWDEDVLNLAACYAHKGELSRAKQSLDSLRTNSHNYALATVETIAGNHDRAIELLADAIQGGYSFGFFRYSYDHHLIPLFDYPRFQRLVAPKE